MKTLKDNWAIILFAIGLMTALALVGCSPQKRLNRKIERAEAFARKHDLVIQDTINVTVRDTIYFPEYIYDTTTKVVHHDTTTIVNNERLRAVYFYDTLTREIWHEIECKGDTVYTEKIARVPVDKIKKTEERLPRWVLWIGIGLIVLIAWWRIGRDYKRDGYF